MERVTVKARVQAVRRRLKRDKLDALIVTGAENVRYLTGFRGHDSWALILPRSVVLMTDSRYTEQALDECIECKVVQRKGSLAKEAARLLDAQKGVSVVGVENGCTVATLTAIRKAVSVKVKPTAHFVESVRQIKSDAEIRLIKKASKIAFDAMDWALSNLKPGITERELAALYVYRLSAYGAAPGFETIVCFGPNGSRNHHQPGGRKLRKTDVVLLDFGANYEGYISDTTRCLAFGKPSDQFCRVYQTVANAQKAAIDAIAPGVKGSDVDAAARAVIEQADLPVYGHGTGHGVGLQVHELPFLAASDKKTTLQVGQVITIEPGIYLPGRFGVRLEDDVLVTQKGPKILSRDKRFDVEPNAVPVR